MNKANSLNSHDLRHYHFISKIFRFSRLKHKIFTVAFVATHIPLFCVIAYLLFSQESISKTSVVVLALISTLLGTTLVLWVLHHLLKPLQLCSMTLNNFLNNGQVDKLPLHINDEMGLLLKNLSHTLKVLNKREIELKKTTNRDFLTGLMNRMAMTQKIDQWTEQKQQFGLAMIDIDHFKEVNDLHGHLAGDAALQQFGFFISQFLTNHTENAWAARWGGEEFLLILPMDVSSSEQLMEQLRKQVQTNSSNYEDLTIQFTISIGLAQYNLDEDINNNIKTADEALFSAKRSGRNQVCLHQP